MAKNQKHVPTHIAKFVGKLNLTPVDELNKMTSAQRVDAADFGLKLELAGKLYAGFALMGLKEEMGHGNYMAALAKRGVPTTSANRCVNLAQLAMRTGKLEFTALVNLPPSKLELMTKWDDAEIKAFSHGDEVRGITIDEAQEFSVRDLTSMLKDSQTSNSELEQQLGKERTAKERAEEQLRLLKRKQNEVEGFIYPESVERVRIESSVLATQAIQCMDDMEQFMIELTQATDLNHKKEKQEAEFSAGASTLYVNLNAIYSKASYLLSWFGETIGEDYMPDKPEDTPLLTKQEALKVFNMREVMLVEHGMEKQARESARKSNRRKNKKAK